MDFYPTIMSKEEIVKHLEQKMQDLLNPDKMREEYESLRANSKQLYELLVSE